MTALATTTFNDGDSQPRRARRPQGRSLPGFQWRDVTVELGRDFTLASGEQLEDARLRLRLHGPEGAPVVIAAGGISSGRMVADAGEVLGWWRDIARLGGAIDTTRHQVFGFDFLPGEERAAKTITPADQARALAFALDAVGAAKAHAYVGASYGGFIGLAFAAAYSDRLDNLCVISASARSDPMTTALRGVQRRIINLAAQAGRAQEGVALARELAMTTYRTPEEFRSRFRGAPRKGRTGEPFEVCEYLISRGKDYAGRMPATRYLTLSDSLDRANVDPAAIRCASMFIAARSDRLVPATDTKRTSAETAGPSRYLEIDSLVGHDAFLCDAPLYAGALKHFLEGDTK